MNPIPIHVTEVRRSATLRLTRRKWPAKEGVQNMASKELQTILDQFKQQISSMELQPDSGGCFEITVDDQLIYSKLETGEFPDEETIVAELGSRTG